MTLAELAAHPDQHRERQEFRYGHVLGRGLSRLAIATWQESFPRHPLPGDVVDALRVINGVHVWADLDHERAYFGIAPLDEWTDFAKFDWVLEDREGCLLISYHDNGDYWLVLDTKRSRYLWIDHEDVGHPLPVGETFSELLGWFWNYAQWLDPNRKQK